MVTPPADYTLFQGMDQRPTVKGTVHVLYDDGRAVGPVHVDDVDWRTGGIKAFKLHSGDNSMTTTAFPDRYFTIYLLDLADGLWSPADVGLIDTPDELADALDIIDDGDTDLAGIVHVTLVVAGICSDQTEMALNVWRMRNLEARLLKAGAA
jgi:hypothetical protein